MQYIKINEVTNMLFYQIPKVLFVGIYKDMSLGAKVVYAFLRDRVSLSIKNNWVDESGNVFIYYAREHLAQDLGISEKSVRNYMKELTKYDLIKEIRQRLTKPNIIYVGTPIDTENIVSGKIYRYGKENDSVKERKTLPTNYTDINKTKKSETNNLQFLDEIECDSETLYYINLFLDIRSEYEIKRHKRVSETNAEFIVEAIENIITQLSEQYEGDCGEVRERFVKETHGFFKDMQNSNKNYDGDIIYFLQVTQYRYFDIQGENIVMKE